MTPSDLQRLIRSQAYPAGFYLTQLTPEQITCSNKGSCILCWFLHVRSHTVFTMWISNYGRLFKTCITFVWPGPWIMTGFSTNRFIEFTNCKHDFVSIDYLLFFSCHQAALWMVQCVCLSVCPSVCPSHLFTMFPLSYHHEIIITNYHWHSFTLSLQETNS